MKKIFIPLAIILIGAFFLFNLINLNSKDTNIKQENIKILIKEQTKIVPDTNYTQIFQKEKIIQTEIYDSIPTKWKTYATNKYNYSFRYPNTWVQNEKDAETIDLFGKLTGVEINFIDSITQSTLVIAYHLPPNGNTLYEYAVSQYNSSQGDKKIEVAGKKAIKTYSTISMDGKGHKLNPAVRLIIVHLMDNKETGEIEFQFRTPIKSEDWEINKFNQLLSSFEFTN